MMNTGKSFTAFSRKAKIQVRETLLDLGGRISDNGIDSVLAALFRVIWFGNADDLAVACTETEPGLSGFIRINLEFRILFLLEILYGLIFDICNGRILLDGRNAVAAGAFGVVELRDENAFAIAGFQVFRVVAGAKIETLPGKCLLFSH